MSNIDRNAKDRAEVTYITQFSYSRLFIIIRFNRFERFKYHLKRWNGSMSIGILVQLPEFPSFVKAIEEYVGYPITFNVYVPFKTQHPSYFIRKNGTKEPYPNTLYPVNLLRDLAIESIHTTHYMFVDADFYISCQQSINSMIYRYGNGCPREE